MCVQTRSKNQRSCEIITAHPAKFPDVIHNAGLKIKDTPNSLSVIFNKKEKIYNFPASKDAIFEFITSNNK